jgi:hypothetical protein
MSARQASLLFGIGSDQPSEVTEDGRPRYRGCTDLHQLFDRREPVHVLRLDRHALRQRKRPELAPYRCILNLITDPDQNPRVLENLKKLLREYSGQVLNPPEAVLRSTRDQISRLLADVPGFVAPKVLRLRNARPDLAIPAIERAGMRFPLIVRLAGTHTGAILGCFDSFDELRAALTQQGDHIVTEFVDFRSADGLYRKYRAFFFGQRIVFRHMIVSDNWNVHARDRMRFMVEHPWLLAEEAEMFAEPHGAFPAEVIKTLEAVLDRMQLDYFGMDFGIAPDGRVILFEANATMNFFPFLADPRFEYLKRCLRPAQEAFHQMLGCSATPAVPTIRQLAL